MLLDTIFTQSDKIGLLRVSQLLAMTLAFVSGVFVKGDEVKHLTHSGAESVAVVVFDLGGGKVSGDVRDGFIFDKMFITTYEYFSHYVAVVTEVFDLLFGTQIVKAITG